MGSSYVDFWDVMNKTQGGGMMTLLTHRWSFSYNTKSLSVLFPICNSNLPNIIYQLIYLWYIWTILVIFNAVENCKKKLVPVINSIIAATVREISAQFDQLSKHSNIRLIT